ncbi:MAG: hypothetical protein R2698_04320 [Microthrixaceae bacterium]
MKVASLLALMRGWLHVDAETWERAGDVVAASDRLRQSVLDEAERKRRAAAKSRTAAKAAEAAALDDDQRNRAKARMAAAMGRKVHRDATPAAGLKRAELTRSTGSDDRGRCSVDDAIAWAIGERWIRVEGDCYYPGDITPPDR